MVKISVRCAQIAHYLGDNHVELMLNRDEAERLREALKSRLFQYAYSAPSAFNRDLLPSLKRAQATAEVPNNYTIEPLLPREDEANSVSYADIVFELLFRADIIHPRARGGEFKDTCYRVTGYNSDTGLFELRTWRTSPYDGDGLSAGYFDSVVIVKCFGVRVPVKPVEPVITDYSEKPEEKPESPEEKPESPEEKPESPVASIPVRDSETGDIVGRVVSQIHDSVVLELDAEHPAVCRIMERIKGGLFSDMSVGFNLKELPEPRFSVGHRVVYGGSSHDEVDYVVNDYSFANGEYTYRLRAPGGGFVYVPESLLEFRLKS